MLSSYSTHIYMLLLWMDPTSEGNYASYLLYIDHANILRPFTDTHLSLLCQIFHYIGHIMIQTYLSTTWWLSVILRTIFSWSCMDHLNTWYAQELNIFGYPFGSSIHSYSCMSCPSSRSTIFQSVVFFFIMGIRVKGISKVPKLRLKIWEFLQAQYPISHLIQVLDYGELHFHLGPYLQVDYYRWVGLLLHTYSL